MSGLFGMLGLADGGQGAEELNQEADAVPDAGPALALRGGYEPEGSDFRPLEGELEPEPALALAADEDAVDAEELEAERGRHGGNGAAVPAAPRGDLDAHGGHRLPLFELTSRAACPCHDCDGVVDVTFKCKYTVAHMLHGLGRLFERHNLSDAAQQDILHFWHAVLPEDNRLPRSAAHARTRSAFLFARCTCITCVRGAHWAAEGCRVASVVAEVRWRPRRAGARRSRYIFLQQLVPYGSQTPASAELHMCPEPRCCTIFPQRDRSEWRSHTDETCAYCLTGPRFLQRGGHPQPSQRCALRAPARAPPPRRRWQRACAAAAESAPPAAARRMWYFGMDVTLKGILADWDLARHIVQPRLYLTRDDKATFFGSPAFAQLEADLGGLFEGADGGDTPAAQLGDTPVLFSIGIDAVQLLNWGSRSVTVVALRLVSLPASLARTARAVLTVMVIEGRHEPHRLEPVLKPLIDFFERYGGAHAHCRAVAWRRDLARATHASAARFQARRASRCRRPARRQGPGRRALPDGLFRRRRPPAPDQCAAGPGVQRGRHDLTRTTGVRARPRGIQGLRPLLPRDQEEPRGRRRRGREAQLQRVQRLLSSAALAAHREEIGRFERVRVRGGRNARCGAARCPRRRRAHYVQS